MGKKSFYSINKVQLAIIFIVGPLIIFLLAMLDVPVKYWMFGTFLFPEWMLDYSLIELFLQGQLTFLVGIVLGVSIVLVYKIWKA